MSDDDDGNLIERVAREMINRHGDRAADIARDHAAIAEGQCDFLSGEIWHEIADVIERLHARGETTRATRQQKWLTPKV